MKTTLVRLTLIGALAAVTAGACVSAAAAAFKTEVPAVRVRFADLDLNTAEGRLALYRRLDSAAHVVCFTLETSSFNNSLPWRSCVDQALGRAVAQIGNAQLTATYLEKRTVPRGDRATPATPAGALRVATTP